ncbi:Putative short-chain dehydrogenase/reductase SDR, NAD(P)-binding domain superfamily [Septoria linicola]|uniref:Short-chain dehydrogenase/reductase SDR, NAD(P)-binding domain superfamily n=1 Tax=Septoria linicola TaxID=215465 RepID=A0A9Q9B4J2_9PEZI|nr:putative short-chain dehydrogenase/reductase SDR, NAD(P)-binding domain superfamily [Septoria linicola]USW57358.1 Putative short-chain dehydrogenase/reductase SDR, NAD(P)-binding domain superfamily [Septoria linicola]
MASNILITGGSRGIGRATAILAGKRGWNVGVNYVNNAEAAEATVQQVQDAGGKGISLKGAVEIEQDVVRMFDEMEAQLGKVTAVVINAGITLPAMPLADMDISRLRQMFDVNILGAYLCAREAARRMPASSGGIGGSIVFVSSAAAKLGGPNEYVDYAGSKGAIDTLTIGLAKELGPKGIRVTAVRPGLIKTDIHATTGDPGRADRLGATTPLGRAGEAEEVAEAIIWLSCSASSYVTGTVLDVTGGR